jgi:hypothetical protein
MLSETSRIRNAKVASFLSNRAIDPKEKHIHKNKHDHVQTHMWNMGKEERENGMTEHQQYQET